MMRNVRMNQHTEPFTPGYPGPGTAGCYLVPLVLWQDVDTDILLFCENDDVKGAKVLGCVI